MPLISGQLVSNEEIIRYKAPKGKLFNVLSVYAAVITNDSNSFMIIDRAMEESGLILPQDQQILFYIRTINVDQQQNIIVGGHKTKYLSAGFQFNTSAQVFYLIEYELVSASKFDLLWEWMSKRR